MYILENNFETFKRDLKCFFRETLRKVFLTLLIPYYILILCFSSHSISLLELGLWVELDLEDLGAHTFDEFTKYESESEVCNQSYRNDEQQLITFLKQIVCIVALKGERLITDSRNRYLQLLEKRPQP